MELSKDAMLLLSGLAVGGLSMHLVHKYILNKSKKIEEVNNKSEEKENK